MSAPEPAGLMLPRDRLVMSQGVAIPEYFAGGSVIAVMGMRASSEMPLWQQVADLRYLIMYLVFLLSLVVWAILCVKLPLTKAGRTIFVRNGACCFVVYPLLMFITDALWLRLLLGVWILGYSYWMRKHLAGPDMVRYETRKQTTHHIVGK